MTIAFWCVLIAGLMPLFTVAIAKSRGRVGGAFLRHNDLPRDWLAQQEGVAKRAHAAHLNCLEAFPLFAAGVIIASLLKAPQGTVDAIAAIFIAARVAYVSFYVNDKATLRSLVWVVGLGCCVALFMLCAFWKA